MREPVWILGISIDEEITWSLTEAIPDYVSGLEAYPSERIPVGLIADLKSCSSPIDIEGLLTTYFTKLVAKHSSFRRAIPYIRAIGVSTIGVTDRSKGQLINISRKDFIMHPTRQCMADFKSLLPKLFPGVRDNIFVFVENDVIAKGLAHHSFDDGIKSLKAICCYINLSEGINIGIVNGHGAISSSDTNPEFGHVYAPLHELDVHFKKEKTQFSGCDLHVTCFEGLASAKRIREQWQSEIDGRPLCQFIAETRDVLNILSHYTAHLCWNAALATAPEKIILGGPLVSTTLLEDTKQRFRDINNAYLRFDALDSGLDRFIGLAMPLPVAHTEAEDLSGLMGALELARIGLRRAGRPHALGEGTS